MVLPTTSWTSWRPAIQLNPLIQPLEKRGSQIWSSDLMLFSICGAPAPLENCCTVEEAWEIVLRKHPGRWTWNIIMEVWKIIFLSKWVICRFHVNLPGCTQVESDALNGNLEYLPSYTFPLVHVAHFSPISCNVGKKNAYVSSIWDIPMVTSGYNQPGVMKNLHCFAVWFSSCGDNCNFNITPGDMCRNERKNHKCIFNHKSNPLQPFRSFRIVGKMMQMMQVNTLDLGWVALLFCNNGVVEAWGQTSGVPKEKLLEKHPNT